MKPLKFDDGMEKFSMNGAVFRLNPRDPGVLSRFFELGDKLRTLEPEGSTDAQLWQDMDKKCRQLLAWVFPGNDFEALLGRGNVMAVCKNGKTVFSNFLEAVMPVIRAGLEEFARQEV